MIVNRTIFPLDLCLDCFRLFFNTLLTKFWRTRILTTSVLPCFHWSLTLATERRTFLIRTSDMELYRRQRTMGSTELIRSKTEKKHLTSDICWRQMKVCDGRNMLNKRFQPRVRERYQLITRKAWKKGTLILFEDGVRRVHRCRRESEQNQK